MNTDDVVELYNKYVMKTYTRVPLCLEKAKGTLVEDIEVGDVILVHAGFAIEKYDPQAADEVIDLLMGQEDDQSS